MAGFYSGWDGGNGRDGDNPGIRLTDRVWSSCLGEGPAATLPAHPCLLLPLRTEPPALQQVLGLPRCRHRGPTPHPLPAQTPHRGTATPPLSAQVHRYIPPVCTLA